MRKLSKLQYEVIFLYSKGLTFKEIDTSLSTASKGGYSQVVAKDKSRVTKAKLSRKINLRNYKEDLKKYLDVVKVNNKHYKNESYEYTCKYRHGFCICQISSINPLCHGIFLIPVIHNSMC